MYHAFNEGKTVIIEYFDRSLKGIVCQYFAANNTYTYLIDLPKMLEQCKFKMTPKQA